jgi:hypothetical protein
MSADKDAFQVEAFLWVRAKVKAKTEEDAVELLMGQFSVDEEELTELCGEDYEIEMVGGTTVEGSDLDEARRRSEEDEDEE